MKICLYGASSDEIDRTFILRTESLGEKMGKRGHTLIFGGGAKGLMGACARGAAEKGGEILGIAPRFFDEPGILFPRCSRFLFTETMAERKSAMAEESEAFIALPGGIGTFEAAGPARQAHRPGEHPGLLHAAFRPAGAGGGGRFSRQRLPGALRPLPHAGGGAGPRAERRSPRRRHPQTDGLRSLIKCSRRTCIHVRDLIE